MKRAMLLVLAGFGLASVLFALVAFVGEGDEKNLVYVTYTEHYGNDGFMLILYPDGKIEETVLPSIDGKNWQSKIKENRKKLTSALIKLHNTYEMKGHSTSRSSLGIYSETYIFSNWPLTIMDCNAWRGNWTPL